MASPLLDVADLRVRYGKGVHSIEAVAGVSFTIARGESVGLVGESGCGKSSLGRALLRLEPIAGGSIRVNGSDPLSFSGSSLFQFRKQMQMVFQDPFGSLNPRMTVGAMLDEVLHVHGESDRSARLQRMDELMGLVGLDAAYLGRFPHEFSGGQRQRIGIARALAVRPELIIADEPVSALDVSVQVQILNLFRDLRKRLNLTYLFIAHDLAVVRYVCDRVLVMYRGQVVESGPSAALFERPAHPYTRLLVDSVPDVEHGLSMRDAGVREGSAAGEDSRTSSTGCPFRSRCARAFARCASEAPSLVETSGGRAVSCHVPMNESGS